MDSLTELSIVICTRNRPSELINCIRSISRQSSISKSGINVVVIDDGSLEKSVLNDIEQMLVGFTFKYIKKKEPGLFRSRILAISSSESPLILFLDDDVEIDENYAENLLRTYDENPGIAGVSGIDILMKVPGMLVKLFHTIFLLKSNKPGRLSLSGYGESMQYWGKCKEIFPTEFLSGSNMSFKKEALPDIYPVEWMNHYSLGEDVYLSYLAGQKGKLIINPRLTVKHHQSPVARDKTEDVAYSDVVNHYLLLKIKKEKQWKYFIQLWSVFGSLLKSVFFFNFRQMKGYLKGMMHIIFKLKLAIF